VGKRSRSEACCNMLSLLNPGVKVSFHSAPVTEQRLAEHHVIVMSESTVVEALADDHKNWCDKELSESETSRDDTDEKMTGLEEKIEEAKSKIQELTEKIQDANDMVEDDEDNETNTEVSGRPEDADFNKAAWAVWLLLLLASDDATTNVDGSNPAPLVEALPCRACQYHGHGRRYHAVCVCAKAGKDFFFCCCCCCCCSGALPSLREVS